MPAPIRLKTNNPFMARLLPGPCAYLGFKRFVFNWAIEIIIQWHSAARSKGGTRSLRRLRKELKELGGVRAGSFQEFQRFTELAGGSIEQIDRPVGIAAM